MNKTIKKAWKIAVGLDIDWMSERKFGFKFSLPCNLKIELYFIRIDLGVEIKKVDEVLE